MGDRMEFRALVLLMLATAVGLLSCAPRASEPEEQARELPPTRGGVLRLIEERPRSLDPALVDSVYDALPVNQIFDGLLGLDASLSIVPALAATWTISRDGRDYVFHLRPGVRFHDGTPLTSDDVAFTIRRALSPDRKRQSLAATYLMCIDGARDLASGKRRDLPGIATPDPRSIAIRLERPYPSFLEVLAMDQLRVVPQRAVERLGDEEFARRPVGTGPFRFGVWEATLLRLDASPDHFAGAPFLDAIEIQFPAPDEPEAGVERFYQGRVDVIEAPSGHLDRLASTPGVSILRYPELSLNFLGFCAGFPYLKISRVRQAIAHAIDRQRIAAEYPAIRRLATGILPPGLPGYSPKPKTLPYDTERARALLAEAGYPNGQGLPPLVVYTANRTTASQRLLDRLATDLVAVGIRLEAKPVSWSEFSLRLEEHTAPAFLLGWIADLADPDAFLRTLFEPGASTNYFDFGNAEISALLGRGAKELHPVERARIYRDMEERILAEAPIVPLYYNVRALALSRAVRDLESGPLGLSATNFRRVWLAPGDPS